ncbi:MAG: HEAT repeat domain-containing protein [Anaerolineae bacterium]|nr:HEAT repeat domain-containing protein [Anaerolineae bacterium]
MSNTHLKVWFQKLQNPDPSMRKSALENLEIMGEPETLTWLADVFLNDPEPALREQAQRIAKAIYYQQHQQAAIPKGATPAEQEQAASILEQARHRKAKRG